MRKRVEYGVLWVVLVLGLCIGSQHAGVSWDEVTYFDFSDHVRHWWSNGAPLDAAALDHAWAYDRYLNPHPPMMRAFSALTRAYSGLPFPTNYRLASLMLCAGLLTGMYALLWPTLGSLGAAFALSTVIFQPRVYGDVLNATTDAPVALAFSVLCLLAWRSAEAAPDKRAWLRGSILLTYSVATAIKFTGFLAIVPVGLYFLWRRQWSNVVWSGLAVPVALCFLILTSPDRWHHPITGVVEYITYPFTRDSTPIATQYFGAQYAFHLPWHYFDVMTALTVPIAVLVALPFLFLVTPPYRSLRTALLFPLGFWIVLVHLPNTPRHDGVRQFLAVMPLLGLLGTLVYLSLIERLCHKVPAARVYAWKSASLTAASTAMLLSFLPWLRVPLSSYNAFAGGLPGAEAMGMETTYLLEVISPDFLSRMNAVLAPGDSILLVPSWPLLRRYQAEGLLRNDIRVVDNMGERPRFLLLVRRRSLVRDELFLKLPALLEKSYDDVVLAKLSPNGQRETRGDHISE
ncbi:MAG TPA: hypothetical protein VFN67_21340 [Polyangiales bacterium]|nr:hypothetical protein [Polyangiales bacterium]